MEKKVVLFLQKWQIQVDLVWLLQIKITKYKDLLRKAKYLLVTESMQEFISLIQVLLKEFLKDSQCLKNKFFQRWHKKENFML
jgi:hypothetical protein